MFNIQGYHPIKSSIGLAGLNILLIELSDMYLDWFNVHLGDIGAGGGDKNSICACLSGSFQLTSLPGACVSSIRPSSVYPRLTAIVPVAL